MEDAKQNTDIAAARAQGRGTLPMADWDRGPWNRWAFQHIAEILPVERIWRGPGPASALPEAHSDILSVSFSHEGREQTAGAYFGSIETDGVLVLHRGKILAEQYYNGMQRQTLHLSQSVGKSVAGAVAGVLIGKGIIEADAPLTRYLPQLQTTAYSGATLRHVLDMTSGVQFNEDYTALDSHMAKMDVACGWKNYGEPGWPKTMWELILSLKTLDRPHGAAFHYRSIETDVLSFAMQAATGLSIGELISRHVWQPMGAEEDASLTVDAAGYGLACGGFNASLRDYARFALLYATGGRANGRQVIPESWIADTQAGDGTLFNAESRYVLPHGAYRNQFWVERAGGPVILGRGVFGQMLFIDPEAEFVGVVLSSWPDFVNPERTRETLAAMRAMRASVS